MNLIEAAKALAHRAHDDIKQVRKYTLEPYWVHTDEVAELVASVAVSPLDNNDNIIAAAHLHDVMEDVFPENNYFDLYTIEKATNKAVAQLVIELTDIYTKDNHPDLNRAERKRLERERLGRTSPAAKTIKLADLISNTRSIVEHDKDFARVYLHEKLDLLPYLADGSPVLLQRASTQTLAGFSVLGMQIPMVTVLSQSP